MPCCYICDKQVDEPKLDPRDMKTTPCSECEAIIQECLEQYEEQEVEQIDQSEDLDEYYERQIELYYDQLELHSESSLGDS